jgi:uncharacterized protein
MEGRDPQLPLPWYRFFWPWFIVILLASTVAAGVATLVIAIARPDPVVRDDWYEDGTEINRRLERNRNARSLGLHASLRLDLERSEMSLVLQGEGIAALQQVRVDFSHATRADHDRSIVLQRSAPDSLQATAGVRFVAPLEALAPGRWYVALTPFGPATSEETDWRLARSLELPSGEALQFGEGP